MTLNQMQLIADYIMEDCGKPKVKVIRNGRRSCSIARVKFDRRSNEWKRTISVAEFFFTRYSDIIALADIIHECCHFLCGSEHNLLNHNSEFREWEGYWLGQFGMSPVGYKKAYYTHLRTAAGRRIATRNQDAKSPEEREGMYK